MAIVRNMWMRNTRQQVAGAVLYNLKGQTIQREKAANVANPRTTAQMDQRVKLANLVNFYRASKAWMAKGAFETKKQTWSDYNAFVSANLDGNEIALTKQMANEGQCIVAPYIVTKGTLPKFNMMEDSGDAVLVYTATAAPTTWGAFSQALIASYPGLQEGDQFSVIKYVQTDADGKYYVQCIPFEKNLNTSSTEALTGILTGAVFGAEGLLFGKASFFNSEQGGIVVCASRSVSGAIKVNDSYVFMLGTEVYDEFKTDAQMSNAIASYGGSSVNFLDNGTTGLSSSASGGSGGGSGEGDPGDVEP